MARLKRGSAPLIARLRNYFITGIVVLVPIVDLIWYEKVCLMPCWVFKELFNWECAWLLIST